MSYILKMENITKSYPGVKALINAQFNLKRGEVHALIGENGAGKSTLMNVLMGVCKSDSGCIIFKDAEYHTKNPKDAQDQGISMIYQEFNLIPDLTVAENIYIAREPRKLKNMLIDDKTMISESQKLLKSLGLDIDAHAIVGNLSVAEKQMVEIAKALVMKSDVLVLDEATSALAENEVQKLFEIIRRLKNENVSIIYISHRLEELDAIVDRVTILRDGQYIATYDWKDTNISTLISMMVGRSLTEKFPKRNSKIGEVIFEAKNINNSRLKNISLSVKRGEILGLAGLMGAGRTEMARAIFGADKIDSGELWLDGDTFIVKSPQDAIRHGIAYLPEDRKKDGLFLDLEINMNILSANLNAYAKKGIIDEKKCKEVVEQKITALTVKTPSEKQIVKYLSGGNQQKVLIARWLCRESKLIIFDEPTRGIDVGAKYEIYTLMNKVAEQGAAIIMISSEMPEILGMSDRIMVMCEGKMMGELDSADATQGKILQMASNIGFQTEEM